MLLAVGEASHSCGAQCKTEQCCVERFLFYDGNAFPSTQVKKRRSLERWVKGRPKEGVLKRRELGELKPGVGGNVVLFYRLAIFSNGCDNSFS